MDRAIEYLECALINCNNVKKLGLPILEIVKQQIQSALDVLEEVEEERDD